MNYKIKRSILVQNNPYEVADVWRYPVANAPKGRAHGGTTAAV